MKAITFHGVGRVVHEDAPDPAILHELDAIVEVELAAICGSDLHVVHGRETGIDPGTVLGHEFVGRVVDRGAGVRELRIGDRVASPFTTSCGRCHFCSIGLSARCVESRLFGWVEKGVGLQGGQAERVRVPLAETTLFRITPEMPANHALLLCDVLPTGHHCARMAEVRPRDVVAIIGCGPVGLMAIACAREAGAERIFALDTVEARLALASRWGAIPISIDDATAAGKVLDATEGRGADAVLEAVGSESASRLAFELVRPGGIISAVGVHHETTFPWSPAQAYDRNLTYRIGRCPARSLMPDILPLLERRGAELVEIFTHRLPLSSGPEAYERFDQKRDGCIKVALAP